MHMGGSHIQSQQSPTSNFTMAANGLIHHLPRVFRQRIDVTPHPIGFLALKLLIFGKTERTHLIVQRIDGSSRITMQPRPVAAPGQKIGEGLPHTGSLPHVITPAIPSLARASGS